MRSPLLLGATPNQNQTFTLSFDSNGGSPIDAVSNIESGTLLENLRPEIDPVYANHMFLGRFDENNERVLFSERIITGDLTLTAKWGDFEEILYTGILDDAEVSYTIMDRNL
ncbi:InlB B-repeat-containing protein [bacterium]|nr:InlB B-repeat-containing protein [bacterium]